MTTENLRREGRFASQIPVTLYGASAPTAGETTDVSFRGLFVVTAAMPAVRSLVRLRVTLPGGAFDVHAMVVHRGEAGLGLELFAFTGAERRAWDAHVRALAHQVRSAVRTPVAPAAAAADPQDLPLPAASEPHSGIRAVALPIGRGAHRWSSSR
jgi:hypothetical protein